MRPGARIRPGDLVEIGPACGPAFTGPDRFRVSAVHRSATRPDQLRLTGQWWPATDDRRVTLTVLAAGPRVLDPAGTPALPPRGATMLLDHPAAPAESTRFRVLDARPAGDGRLDVTGWFVDAAECRELRLRVPAGALRPAP